MLRGQETRALQVIQWGSKVQAWDPWVQSTLQFVQGTFFMRGHKKGIPDDVYPPPYTLLHPIVHVLAAHLPRSPPPRYCSGHTEVRNPTSHSGQTEVPTPLHWMHVQVPRLTRLDARWSSTSACMAVAVEGAVGVRALPCMQRKASDHPSPQSSPMRFRF